MSKTLLRNLLLSVSGVVLLSSCGTYHVTSGVPEEIRTISVPVFENKTGFPEVGAIATQYTLREIQREGTFKIAPLDSSSFKLLCTLSTDKRALSFNRSYGSRAAEYKYKLIASVTLIERSTGKLLLDDVKVEAITSFMTNDDLLTGMQDAGPRAAKELSRAIVDTVLALWLPKDAQAQARAIELDKDWTPPPGSTVIKFPQDAEDQLKPRPYR
jgi:Lipopolysaccharide-assembly